jgi:hypothetical protein
LGIDLYSVGQAGAESEEKDQGAALMPKDDKPSEYDTVVLASKMPPCPICEKPIRACALDAKGDRVMVFIAHGMVALAHDGCRVDDRDFD